MELKILGHGLVERDHYRDYLAHLGGQVLELQPVATNDGVKQAIRVSANALAFHQVSGMEDTAWTEENAISRLAGAMKAAGFQVETAEQVAKKVVTTVVNFHDNFLMGLARS